jgi:hypothetical protein
LKEQGLYDANEIKDVITDADSNNVRKKCSLNCVHAKQMKSIKLKIFVLSRDAECIFHM